MRQQNKKRLRTLQGKMIAAADTVFAVACDDAGQPLAPIPSWATVAVLIPDNGRGDCTLPGSQPRRYDA